MNECYTINISGLTKSFKEKIALDGINLIFEPGNMHGVIGPEGAGKTTLFRIITGLLSLQGGSITFSSNGTLINRQSVKKHIAYMPERQSLYPDLSIEEHLRFFSALYKLSEEEYQDKTSKLLSMTRLKPFLDRPAKKLSGGMYKKLGLMCALLGMPKILILDEPTNGVDPISRREFWELLYGILNENITILISTAYMDEAERCMKSHLIQDGKLIVSGSPKDLLKEHNVANISDLFIKLTKPGEINA
jgi:ABC-2 type transport system ATP-binding protein